MSEVQMNIQQTAHRDLAEKNALTEENTQLKENENNVREGMRFKPVQSRSTVKSRFIVARLNGESRHIKIKKEILIVATFNV